MESFVLFNCDELEFNSHMWLVAALWDSTFLEDQELELS